jgi:hypothetical protein
MASGSASVSFLIPSDDGAVPQVVPAAGAERFCYALVLSKKWGKEFMAYITPDVLVRESVPCTMLLYQGHFSDLDFAAIQKPLASGGCTVLSGAGPRCYAWAGMSHELMALPWGSFMGAGFTCFHCKDHTTKP